MKKGVCVFILLFSVIQGFAQNEPALFRHAFKPGEMTLQVQHAIQKASQALDQIVALPHESRNFSNTILALEHTMAEFFDQTQPLLFLRDVLVEEDLRNEALRCEPLIRKFKADVLMRGDLFRSFEATKQNIKQQSLKLDLEDQRLITVWDLKFRKSGVKLEGEVQEELHHLKAELIVLEAEFEKNINANNDVILITSEELEGLPNSLRSQIEARGQSSEGYYTVSTKTAEYVPFMEYAQSAHARKRLYEARTQRAASQNMPLLERSFQVKARIAHLLGYDNWVSYQTDGLMTQNDQNVKVFLETMQAKIAPWYERYTQALLALKRQTDPKAMSVEPWEEDYFSRKFISSLFDFSPEEVRQYFPLEKVIAGLLRVYSRTFGIQFTRIQSEDLWHPTVQLYEATDARTHTLLGHFYLDLYPREGKFQYAEAEAPEIFKGRVLPNGGYQKPLTAIVVNMPSPVQGLPSLLSPDEVQTIAHEFGHVLHELLTEARYGSFSGFLTEMDFADSPPQLLEYGILEPQILDEISGHFLTDQKLPAVLRAKIIQAQQFQMHIYEMELLFLSFLDFDFHTVNRKIDIRRAYLYLRQKILKIQSRVGESFPASFGYLMDPAYAGTYYAYLWSRAIAKDFAERFQDTHWAPSTGGAYRKTIFSQGGSRPASLLVDKFLERPPFKTVELQKSLAIQTISFTEQELHSMSRRLAGKYIDIFQRNSMFLTPEQAFREAARAEALSEVLIERMIERDFLTKIQRASRRRLIAQNISDHFLRQFRRTLTSR